jgi:hypothetical protein
MISEDNLAGLRLNWKGSVEFIDENGGGPGVRLRERQLKKRITNLGSRPTRGRRTQSRRDPGRRTSLSLRQTEGAEGRYAASNLEPRVIPVEFL